MPRARLQLLTIFTTALTIAGCTGGNGTPAGDSVAAAAPTRDTVAGPVATLQGGEWQIETIDGAAVVAGSRITLSFGADGRSSGRACNSYSGEYQVSGDSLRISKTMSTKMACSPDELMSQEATYLRALETVTRFEIRADEGLVLHLVDGRSVIARR